MGMKVKAIPYIGEATKTGPATNAIAGLAVGMQSVFFPIVFMSIGIYYANDVMGGGDFGLYGIAANIHEWCADWHSREYYASAPRRNPAGPETGTRRASRGGSWRHAATISRCSARSRLDPSFRYTDYGFRVVRPQSDHHTRRQDDVDG